MDVKKVVIIAVLVVVIVLAAVFTAKRSSSSGTSAAVQATHEGIMGVKADKIDNKSFEIISETISDWNSKYSPDADGHFKNPKTGEYTMVATMKCASCGAIIPYPDIPPEVRQGRRVHGKRVFGEGGTEQILLDYMCPKCGKHAYSLGGK